MDQRTELIRDRAYQIWLAEGQPSDRHADHWRQAEKELDGAADPHAAEAAAVGPAAEDAGASTGLQADAGAGVASGSGGAPATR